ncbi:MAG: hypothetical protein ABSD73_10425 [Candidatus Bathyarchaeia archaeon]|jgi:hypothetical protein
MRTLIVNSGSHEYPEDTNVLTVGKRFFYLQAKYSLGYIYEADITNETFMDLKKKGVDLFTFAERSFLRSGQNRAFPCENDSISLLEINSFEDWWRFQIKKDVRNRIRNAERKGIVINLAEIDENFVIGAQRIYNETPIRQGRRYAGYGLNLATLRAKFSNLSKSEVLGAYYDGGLVGLLWMVYGDRVVEIRSFVSLIKHRNKSPNNALMAEGLKRCSKKGFRFIVYGKMGYLPSLDSFKMDNGFRECVIPRYYVPLSKKGMLAIKLRVHKELQYSLSPRISRALLPLYSLASKAFPPNIWQRLSD